MDEVDGMSAGDRGGVGALNAMIKKSKVPPPSLACTCLIDILGSAGTYYLYRQ
jgi:hypothetical protein